MGLPYTDLPITATSPSEIGAPQVSYPLLQMGDAYARTKRRQMIVQAASFAPILGTLTSYTNLLTYSEAFDNGAWSKTNVTVVADQIANPADGSVNADKLTIPATAVTSCGQGVVATSTSMTYMVAVKKGDANGDFNNFLFYNSTVPAVLCQGTLNYDTGVFTKTGGSGTASVLNLGGGWWCVIMEASSAITIGNTLTGFVGASGETITVGRYIYAWGAQINAGTRAPYIPTTSVARTVSAPPIDSTAAGVIADPFSYLVDETAPEPGLLDLGTAKWERLYARIPKQSTEFSTLSLTKPSPQGYASGAINLQRVTGGGTTTNLGANSYYLGYVWNTTENAIYGPNVNITCANSGADKIVTWTGHGITTGQFGIYNLIAGDSWELFSSGNYTVVNANAISLTGWAALGLNSTVASKYLRSYTPGTDRVGVKILTDYYLPGVTVGINSAGDIPIPTPLLNDQEFLAACVNNVTGYVNYDAKDLGFWTGLIYQLGKIQINMADI